MNKKELAKLIKEEVEKQLKENETPEQFFKRIREMKAKINEKRKKLGLI